MQSPTVVPIFMAMIEVGRSSGGLTAEEEQGLALRMRELDAIAKRPEDDDPDSTAAFQADRERRLAANLRALEREEAEREAV